MKENMEKIAEMTRLSIFEVFEKMFYIFLEPSDGKVDGYDMEALIEFEGSARGEIRILLSRNMVRTMVQNMLNLEEGEITRHNIEDCSKEAVNMVAGNLFGKLDNSEMFNLSIPTFKPEYSGPSSGENAYRMDFDSDGEKVGVIIDINGRV